MKNTIKKEEDWSRNLVCDMENLLDTGTLTDVSIRCDKKTIKCHKAVLSARSAVFRAMFQHDMRENKNNEIIIPVNKHSYNSPGLTVVNYIAGFGLRHRV